MPWLEIKIDTHAQSAPAIENALLQAGALSVTLSDTRDEPLYEPALGTTPLWRYTRVTGLFEAAMNCHAVLTQINEKFGPAVIVQSRIDALADQPWERAWMEHFAPMQFGQRIWICPSWCEPPDPLAVNIFMDPGLAFGTGTHSTTALCLEWLDAHPPIQQTVIDYGCGSGILAVAAARLGAQRVIAVDHDPQALLATRENAQRNAVAECIETFLPEQAPALAADTLIANILANPLRELATRFADLVKCGGTLVLSGILTGQEDDVTAAYLDTFNLRPAVAQHGWVRLNGTRKC
ncbi:MAG: 50S ribosomal protein L11 methyltransferase [Gammaproteobacteria bacterium]|nr:50S ribosomal protein L11 methyltransferase [Gammaproteobacteria bacterium]